MRCPTCHQEFEPAQSEALPFCCKRCWQIDLGRWLKEGYSVPVYRTPEDIEESDDETFPFEDED